MSKVIIRDYPKYLYQYTSIETLALILKNRTIRFNSLQNVDDLEEAQSSDIKNYGKFTFVSCWANDEKENIALWNMYTEKMKGVRIKLPTYSLKDDKEFVEKQLLNNDLDLIQFGMSTYDTGTDIETKNDPWGFAHFYCLIEVIYTDDESKINKTVIRKQDDSQYYRPIEGTELGEYKREQWEFQKEWRYVIHSILRDWKKEDNTEPSAEEIKLLEQFDNIPNGIYVHIDDNAFEDMEILLGPNTTEADKIIVQSLIDKYNSKAQLNESYLKGKVRNKL